MSTPNRIESCFATLRAKKAKAFIPYICAGDPTLDKTVELSLALEKAGADILELGLPFSDPLADGLVNQLASQRALAAGATVRGVLQTVRTIRQTSQIPIVLYTYLNPIVQFGWDEFHAAAAEAGVDGLLILDLPPEEDTTSGDDRIVHVRLVAPTTPPERMKQIAAKARGFIYYVSREGVTGVREGVSASLPEQVKMLRQVTDLPIAVGFGISTPDQARAVAETADGVVVGSAIVSKIAESGKQHDLVARISEFVRPIAEATKR